MTRTLFFLTCLATIGVALTALPIRWELAHPSVTLFLTADGQPDGHLFNEAVTAHKLLCYLAVMLVGTALSAAARDKGAPIAAIFMWLGVCLSVSLTLLIILLALPPIGVAVAEAPGAGVGWVLYPPLTGSPGSLLLQLFPQVNPFFLGYIGQQIALPANAMLYLGIYAMAATLPKFRYMAIVGALTVALALWLTTRSMRMTVIPYDWLWIVVLVAPFLICAALSLLRERRPWLIVLTFGVVFTVATPTLLAQLSKGFDPSGTVSVVALQYLFPMGLAWFALPAHILFTNDTRLPNWFVWLITPIIAKLLSLWILPMFALGTMGMPAQYVDYPIAFADLSLATSTSVAVFAFIYFALVLTVHRARS